VKVKRLNGLFLRRILGILDGGDFGLKDEINLFPHPSIVAPITTRLQLPPAPTSKKAKTRYCKSQNTILMIQDQKHISPP
jgi:hypothetical protein